MMTPVKARIFMRLQPSPATCRKYASSSEFYAYQLFLLTLRSQDSRIYEK